MQSRRTSAHVTTVYEIDMTRIAKLREQEKASFAELTGTKLSYMPFIFQAVNNALRKFPIFNAQVSGDDGVHFEAVVISDAFQGKLPLARHRMVYATLGTLMGGEIHALALRTLTPQEAQASH